MASAGFVLVIEMPRGAVERVMTVEYRAGVVKV